MNVPVLMKRIIISHNPSSKSPIIEHFYHDLSPLIRMRGFQLIKYFDALGHLVAIDWFSFARREVLFTIQADRQDVSIFSQMQPYIEQIVSELSIFQLVDIFLFDELGLLESYAGQIQQQIITVFSSRIPVLAVVQQNHLQKIDYLRNLDGIDYQSIGEANDEQLYLKLIGELYDR